MEKAARALDAYAGAAADVRPALGTIPVPLRLLAALREALQEEKAAEKPGDVDQNIFSEGRFHALT